MRVSIWQQFSSNHSGFFSVVGVFKTVEDAHNASEELRSMLQEIDRWHRNHKEESKAAFDIGRVEPLPPEAEFAEKYSVEWPSTIDWANWALYHLEGHPAMQFINTQSAASTAQILIEDAIRTIENVVIAQNPDQTWMTMQPFKGLLEYFGANTISFDNNNWQEWENWRFRVICSAPNDEIAHKLEIPDTKLSLTVKRDGLNLIYEFDLTTWKELSGLIVVLKSNSCTNINIEFVPKP